MTTDHPSDLHTADGTEAVTIDVVREDVAVGRRVVETGRVEIAKTVETEAVELTLPRLESGYDVERRAAPSDELLEAAPAGTYELPDGTVVYRVVHEVPVVVTRYRVAEEIHVRPRRVASDDHHVVHARRERVDVRRVPARPAAPTAHS